MQRSLLQHGALPMRWRMAGLRKLRQTTARRQSSVWISSKLRPEQLRFSRKLPRNHRQVPPAVRTRENHCA